MFLESDDLPDGWHWISIGDVATVGTGATPLKKNEDYYFNGQIPWVTSGNLNTDFITNTDEKITELAVRETNAKIFPLHTLLVAMYGEGQTRGRVSELLIEAATNQACAAIILEGCAFNLKPYIKLFFVRNYTEIRKKSSGGVQPNLNLGIIKATKIPLPPLNEQRRIVSTIEQLTARSHKARAALEDVPKLIAQFRQSVLAAAFRGDLTADWREKNPDIEPASELLERIKIDLDKRKPPRQIETSTVFDIPETWNWTSPEAIATHKSGVAFKSSDFVQEGIQVIRLGNIYKGKLDLSRDPVSLPCEYLESNFTLKQGDIVVSQTGTRFKKDYGYLVLIPHNITNLFLNQRLLAVSCHPSIDPEYVVFAGKLETYRNHFFASETGGVNQGNVGVSGVMESPIPLAPLAESKEIVKKIKDAFSIIDILEKSLIENQQYLENLDRSILAKAFRGELVPQDPNDEPAAVLLERIRAEREQTITFKQRGKTTRKNSSKQLSIEGIE